MTRAALPDRRPALTISCEIDGKPYAVTIGLYEDGRLGEIFVSAPKTDTDIGNVLRDAAIIMSFAIQHGADLDAMLAACTRDEKGRLSSIIGRLAAAVVGMDEAAS